MKFSYSYYTLEKCLHNAEAQFRKGALLKIEFDNGLIGYADCHPWPEIGDKPIEEQLDALRHRHTTPLTRCSLYFARLDAEARSQNQALLTKDSIPLSHFLIMDLLMWNSHDIDQLIKQGYTRVKVKLGMHLSQEITYLIKLFQDQPLRLVLDFNEKLSAEEFSAFLKTIGSLKESIDFIEDPFPFDPKLWKAFQEKYSVRLACDKHSIAARYHLDSASILVVKPAIQSADLFREIPIEKIVVTSYLDHPLGQLAAAYVCAQLDAKKENIHGLLTHHAYQPNLFSRSLSQSGPQFTIPQGHGFGYDEELSNIKWTPLNEY